MTQTHNLQIFGVIAVILVSVCLFSAGEKQNRTPLPPTTRTTTNTAKSKVKI